MRWLNRVIFAVYNDYDDRLSARIAVRSGRAGGRRAGKRWSIRWWRVDGVRGRGDSGTGEKGCISRITIPSWQRTSGPLRVRREFSPGASPVTAGLGRDVAAVSEWD